MCGIAGVWNRNGKPVDVEELAAMTRMSTPRGPDGEGYALLNRGCLGLGHRRLSVLDLSDAGRQPMALVGSGLWISYNGEVFNFLELRSDLEARGHRFVTDTDTEVVLAAYNEWGLDCLAKFIGMWALAIWDASKQELILARDRYGIKPLVYSETPDRFIFASEQKALLGLESFDLTPHESMGFCQMWTGVEFLPAGHLLIVKQDSVQLRRWWIARDHFPSVPASYAEQVEQFREVFLDACRIRMRSDVPLVTSISGGIDSSAVLCGISWLDKHSEEYDLARRPDDFQKAFHVFWPNTIQDERRYAELAVGACGATPIWYDARADETFDIDTLEEYLFQTEGYPGLAPWLLYRQMRSRGIVVTLDGQGSDELLGGYWYHVTAGLAATGGYLSAPLRTYDLARTVNGMQGNRLLSLPSWLARGSRLWRAMAKQSGRGGWADRPEWAGAPFGEIERLFDSRELDGLEPMARHQYLDVHRGHLPRINAGFDLCSMSHSIEIRCPFQDWRLVNLALALPDTTRVKGGYTKRILRDAMAPFVPAEICDRKPKLGFNAPDGVLLANTPDFNRWITDHANSPEMQAAEPRLVDLSKRFQSIEATPLVPEERSALFSAWYKQGWAAYGRQRRVSGPVDSSLILARQ